MSNWYSMGLAGQQKFKEMEELRQITSSQTKIRRFKLKPGDSAKVIFLEHPKVWLYEHSVQVEGRWENFTCTADRETCPLCMSGNKQSAILVTTIIDCRKTISSKTGKEYQYQKTLLVMKGKAIRAMMRQFLEGAKVDLTHYSVEIERDTDTKSVGCGEIFTLGKKVSVPALEKLAKSMEIDPKEYLKPFNYFEMLAPKSENELMKIAGMRPLMGSDEGADLDELGLNLKGSSSFADPFSDDVDVEDSDKEGDEDIPFDTNTVDKKTDAQIADDEEDGLI